MDLGIFPHWLWWVLDNPVRRLLIRPEQFANRLPLASRSWVLEVGAGSGYFSAELARRVPAGHLAVVDVQDEMLAKSRRKLEGRGYRNASFVRADAGADLPFPDGRFDVAVLVAVLGEVRDRARCLRSLHRVVRPGGALVVHEHLPDPDLIPFGTLRTRVEAEGFTFRQRWGPAWNYTALFERPRTAVVPPPAEPPRTT